MEAARNCTIDELGRIVLPSELRSKLGWGTKDKLSFYYADQNTVLLQLSEKYEGAKCIFCGAHEAAKTINCKDICGGCLENIKN